MKAPIPGQMRAALTEPCIVTEHDQYGPWCTSHLKIMACDHLCAARWRESGVTCQCDEVASETPVRSAP